MLERAAQGAPNVAAREAIAVGRNVHMLDFEDMESPLREQVWQAVLGLSWPKRTRSRTGGLRDGSPTLTTLRDPPHRLLQQRVVSASIDADMTGADDRMQAGVSVKRGGRYAPVFG